jgi:5-methylcytosine-specific restriction endonuclease McrA
VSRAALSVDPRAGRSKLRDGVFARDRGVCAVCGVETEVIRSALDTLLVAAKQHTDSLGRRRALAVYRGELKRLGIHTGTALWEADHIVPISEGGSDTFDNLRTLCAFRGNKQKSCHAAVTAELARRRSRRPQKATANKYRADGDRLVRLDEDGNVDEHVADIYGNRDRYELARRIAKLLNLDEKRRRR